MSTRIACDRCGHDCTPPAKRSVIHLTELEFAASDPRNPAGQTSYVPADLCDPCTQIVKAAMDCALAVIQVPGEFEMERLEMAQPYAPPLPMRQPHPVPWDTRGEDGPALERPLPPLPDGPGHTLAMEPVTEEISPGARHNSAGD